MHTKTIKSPRLSSGDELNISLFGSSYIPTVMIHSENISSERSITNTSFRKVGSTIFLFTVSGSTSIKISLASIEDAELAADILVGFGVSASNTFSHPDSNLTTSRMEVLDVEERVFRLAQLKDRWGFVCVPSFEVSFDMNASSMSVDSPFPKQPAINLQLRSHSENGFHSYINFLGIKRASFFDIESFYKKLRFPMPRMNNLTDEVIAKLLESE